jgi:hypothetical protein
MAQQSSGEFASANPTKGEEDARVQERGIRAKISLSACSNTKYLQRPTPSHLNKNAPSLQGLSHAGVARSRRRGVSHLGQNPERLRRGAECARALEHISEGVPLRLDGQGFAHAQRDKDVKIARVGRNGRRRETACQRLLAMREFDHWGRRGPVEGTHRFKIAASTFPDRKIIQETRFRA